MTVEKLKISVLECSGIMYNYYLELRYVNCIVIKIKPIYIGTVYESVIMYKIVRKLLFKKSNSFFTFLI